MKALISINEIVNNFDETSGYRVAQVSEEPFEVCPELFWIDCSNEVVADQYYYDPDTQTINIVPLQPVRTVTQPTSIGTQDF